MLLLVGDLPPPPTPTTTGGEVHNFLLRFKAHLNNLRRAEGLNEVGLSAAFRVFVRRNSALEGEEVEYVINRWGGR